MVIAGNVSGQMLVTMAVIMTREYNPDCKEVLKIAQLRYWKYGTIKLPERDALPGNDDLMSWSYFPWRWCVPKNVHDEALYPQSNLTIDKHIYNYRHSRARRISENSFGILANRWRVYFIPIPLSPEKVENIILATPVPKAANEQHILNTCSHGVSLLATLEEGFFI